MTEDAFVRREMRAKFEADQKAAQDADWREQLSTLVSDAMKQTGGL